MKYIKNLFRLISVFVFFVVPSYSFAITNGMNASDVLGQLDQTNLSNPTPVYIKGGINNGSNIYGYNGVTGVLIDTVDHRAFVSEINNNRVLVYNLATDNSFPDKIPDYVLGQQNLYTNTTGRTQNTFNQPRGLAYDSSTKRLFVADYGNGRVMVFNVTTITNGMNAANVLGQVDFTTLSSTLSQNILNIPIGLAFDSSTNRLFVTERNNNRVTIFDVAAITNGENAVNVLGQPDFVTNGPATTSSKMNLPRGVVFDPSNNRLYVSEQLNNRVLVFDVASVTDGEPAINVLGQPDFVTSSSALNASKMNLPLGLAVNPSGSRLYVSDSSNRRVLVFDVASVTDGEPAINVLGQPDFVTSLSSATQSGLISGGDFIYFHSASNKLYIPEGVRIMIFDVASITDGENAVDLLGQYDQTDVLNPVPIYTKSGANDGPNRFGFNQPYALDIDKINHRLFVADRANNRVLVYNLNTDNTFPDRIPDFVLGQANFYSNTAATTINGMNTPINLFFDSTNNRLFVSESGNHRVTVYNTTSITNGQSAVNVLGQPDFVTNTALTTATGMNSPQGIFLDSATNRLFVAQSVNNRVTVYDVASITNGQSAIYVLGQPDFTTSTALTTATGMNSPSSLDFDSSRNYLFVNQVNSNRVAVYDVASITDGEPAINVLGQLDFTSSGAANTQAGLNSPRGIAFDSVNNILYVSQAGNHRVTTFDVASITNGEPAINVLGQTNFTNSSAATTQSGMSTPQDVLYDSTTNRLFVLEWGNNRITIFDLTPPAISSIYSPPGAYFTGQTISITVYFTSPVNVTGNPLLALSTGGNATYSSGSGTNALTFTYTVQETDKISDLDYASTTALSLNGGTILNSVSNDVANLTLPAPGASNSLSNTSDILINQKRGALLLSPSITFTSTSNQSNNNIPTTINQSNTTNNTSQKDKYCPAFEKSFRLNDKDDRIGLVQAYLKETLKIPLAITGFYGPKTFEAVKKFQLLHKDKILTPWNFTKPTGIWHITSRRTAALLLGCPDPTGGAPLTSFSR